MHLRHPGHGRGIENAVAHNAETPGPFADQNVSVGHEENRPWMLKPLDHCGHSNLMLLRSVENDRGCGRIHVGNAHTRRGARLCEQSRRGESDHEKSETRHKPLECASYTNSSLRFCFDIGVKRRGTMESRIEPGPSKAAQSRIPSGNYLLP